MSVNYIPLCLLQISFHPFLFSGYLLADFLCKHLESLSCKLSKWCWNAVICWCWTLLIVLCLHSDLDHGSVYSNKLPWQLNSGWKQNMYQACIYRTMYYKAANVARGWETSLSTVNYKSNLFTTRAHTPNTAVLNCRLW